MSTVIQHFIQTSFNTNTDIQLHPLKPGLSKRHYYRFGIDNKAYIACDASEDKSELSAFIHIAAMLKNAAVLTPMIYFSDLTQGFLILEDLGSDEAYARLNNKTYLQDDPRLLAPLAHFQQDITFNDFAIPPFDRAFYEREWGIFTEGYVKKHLGLDPAQHHKMLHTVFEMLVENNQEQPAVFVHRDYHSQNLFWVKEQVGVLDFQSAKIGPISYDVISLLRDCYCDFDPVQIDELIVATLQKLYQGLNKPVPSEEKLLRHADFTSLQRHLKVMGQFAQKLEHNASFLPHLKRVENYAKRVCARYEELKPLEKLVFG
jgi:aminoglycoside/choline kinase family phosphotransferase